MHKNTHKHCYLPVLQLGGEKQGKGGGRRLCSHLYPLYGGFYPELLHGPAGLGDVVGGGGCFARHFQGSREVLLGKTRGCYSRRQHSTPELLLGRAIHHTPQEGIFKNYYYYVRQDKSAKKTTLGVKQAPKKSMELLCRFLSLWNSFATALAT